MSRSKGQSSFHEARHTAQMIYLICVGLPDVPHGGLRPCDGIRVVITIADVLLMCVGFLPANPTPVTDHTIS